MLLRIKMMMMMMMMVIIIMRLGAELYFLMIFIEEFLNFTV